MLSFLPERIRKSIDTLDKNKVYEIRLRAEMPVCVFYYDRYAFLTESGLSAFYTKAIKCEKSEIETTVLRACEHSLYSVDEQIREGFITTKNGVRIGVAGEYVLDNGTIKNVCNFQSLNIRLPHRIINCSKDVYRFATDKEKIFSTLIVAPVGVGKTTVLRDLTEKISRELNKNILVCDERNELSPLWKSSNEIVTVDVIKYAKKSFALENGVRAMCPEIVVTDELRSKSDIDCVSDCILSGVKVIATCHGKRSGEAISRKIFSDIAEKKLFDRYVELSERKGKGTIERVLDKDFNAIYENEFI